MSECEKIQPLLSGFMDKELAPTESQDVSEHLTRCESCRKSYEEIRDASSKLDSISFVEPTDEVLRSMWKSPFNRAIRSSALFFIIGGLVALTGYGFYEYMVSDEPVFPRVATGAIVLGFVYLLMSVIRERVKTYKTDPYKEVER